MSEFHPLKTLLIIHLASDTSAALHLPFVLNTITSDALAPSPHLSKWTTRIQALLHSKDPGGRWAGLVLAQKTAILSQSLLLEQGQSWVGVALPILSKNEPIVVLKAAIRLVKTILGCSHEIIEFRRQVATPNIPKFVAALIPLAEKPGETELNIVAITTLVNLVSLYPTLHKPSHTALSKLALRFLDGHAQAPIPKDLLMAASRLYATLHATGGKVGSASLWRKSVNETLAFGTNAYWSLRTTSNTPAPPDVLVMNEDPIISIPLNLDRLRCAVTILDDLLGALVYRPVQVPVGPLARFALQLVRTSTQSKSQGFIDPTIHTLEESVVLTIQALGCQLLTSLAEKLDHRLQPYLGNTLTTLAIRLEEKTTSEHRYALLQTLTVVLRRYHSSHSPVLASRLVKAVLPSISIILANPQNDQQVETSGATSSKGRKGKKKAQSYEGDEVFSSSRSVICPADIDGQVLLSALEALRLLLQDPHLSAAIQSISVRVLIAALMTVTRIPPSTLSPNTTLHQLLTDKIQSISTEFVSGSSSVLSKSLPIVADAVIREGRNTNRHRQLDLLLHPRLPPIMRAMPLPEHLSLFQWEELQEETELRRTLGMDTKNDDDVQVDPHAMVEDQEMTPTTSSKASFPAPVGQIPSISVFQRAPITIFENAVDSTSLTSTKQSPAFQAAAPSSKLAEPTPTILEPTSPLPQPPQPTQQQALPMQAPPKAIHRESLSTVVPLYKASVDEDEDQEMPALDLDSDSDVDE